MSFPKPFLIELAREKQLADREAEVFLALFGEGKTRLEIAQQLHVQESAVSTCLSGVYRKFSISGSGPVKENRLKDELRRREEIWQKQQSNKASDQPSTPSQADEAWIEQVREHCRQRILSQHSRMQLLSGKEIGVDQLYVDVYLLDRPEHTLYKSPESLLKTFDIENDRLALGRRIGDRNPGFDVANDNSKLIIFGKPGAGKTTFLKHLAVDWCNGKFQPESIAVLIELRRIRDKEWNLIDAINQELGLENWRQIKTLLEKIKELGKNNSDRQSLEEQVDELRQEVKSLLKQNKLLVLMDGLDEVPTDQLRHNVQRQLQEIAKNYSTNRLVLTCRTQIMGAIPTSFTSVEIADFNEEQVRRFVQNWFIANGKSSAEAIQRWEKLSYVISNNLALKELTTTPVLLSLICLVLHDEGEIPTQRDWLYQKGIKLMLSRWNDAKQIDDWEIGTVSYRRLGIEQKVALLTEIAARKFENPENFVLFQQDEIAAQITQSLQLSNSSDGIAVLKAIEAQHGLLIERADELWSFSHLTFQEYFTIQWLTQLPPEELARKIASQQWQERVKEIVKSQQPADRLVQLIKQAIDRSITNKPEIQAFFAWVLQQADSSQTIYKPAAVRAFYFGYALNLDRALALVPALDRALALDLAFALNLALDRDLDYDKLANELSQIMSESPIASLADFYQWWEANGDRWTERLWQVMIEHRNIGQNWQFTKTQSQQLKSYYDLNKFLVELIKIEGAVTDTVRGEIEDNLLLPWQELQHYPM